nr:hypothetical protein [Alteromonas macleodii]
MYEDKKVLLWLGCGNVASNFLNLNFSKFDEVIFVDGLKHACWEVEGFAEDLECSTIILNNVVSESSVEGTFYEMSDGRYSYFSGQEAKKPPHVDVIDSFKVKSIGFADVLSFVGSETSRLSIICEIPSLSTRLSQFILEHCDAGFIDELYLSEWNDTSMGPSYGDNDSVLREHHFIRESTLNEGGYNVSKYHFSKHEFCLSKKNEEIRGLRESNRNLSKLLEQNKDKLQSLYEKIERFEEIVDEKISNLSNNIDSKIQARVGSLQAFVTKSHSNICKQIEDFFSVRNYIDNGNKPLSFHGWPISPDVSLHIVSLLSTGSYSGVLEFGSGTSTALIGRVLKRIALDSTPIPFISFDHNAQYFEKTKELLTLHEVSSYVDLNCCELIVEEFGGVEFQYYACRKHLQKFAEMFEGSGHKILVLVDGPPGATNLHARYPALPIIMEEIGFNNFSVDFLVDDYGRQEEKEVVEKWKKDVEQAGFDYSNEIIASEKGFSIFRVLPRS